MGKEAAVERYEPGPDFEEVKEEATLGISPTESKEFWLIQWIKDKDLDASGFHGQELSLELHKDGNLGSLESSSGQSYDLVSFAYQQPDATVFLPSGSETKAVGKISRRVCLVRHQEHEESKKQNFGSLAPSRKKSTVNSDGNSASKGKQGKEEREKARQGTLLHPKHQLLAYASKRGIQKPFYCDMQQGPPFKSKVVIDGLTFESPEEYPTRRAAGKAAAKLALASLPDPSSVPSIPHKGILGKLAEKEHYPLPHYSTMVTRTHPAFISAVEFQAVPLMQDAMSMPSSGQEIQSGEPGPSVPKMNDSDAGSSKEALAKNYCSSQGEKIPEHKRKREDESNVGDPNVSGKTSEGPDAPGAQSNTATEMLQNTAKEPPKKKVKIARQ